MSTDPFSLPPLDAEWLESPQARSVEFVPTREDLIAGFRYLFGPQPAKTSSGRPFLVLALMIGLVSAWLFLRQLTEARAAAREGQPPPAHPVRTAIEITVLLTFAIALLALYVLSRQTIEKQIDRKLADPEKARGVLAPRRVTIGPKGCLLQIGAASQTFGWDSINRIEISANYCFIIANRNLVVAAIPHRAFADDQAFRNFHESCRQFREATSNPTSPDHSA